MDQVTQDVEPFCIAPTMFGKGSLWHLVKVGARVSPLELLAVSIVSVPVAMSQFQGWFLRNLFFQVALFLPVVQIPAMITGHMSYVDIGWPGGLVLLAYNTIFGCEGDWKRRWLVGGCLFLHGARMFFGALVMFYPYVWPEDLPRYKYAKERFVITDGMDAKLWPVKQQHDIVQQLFANVVPLAVPMVLSASNKAPQFGLSEFVGLAIWAGSWVWENMADAQMLKFKRETKRQKISDAVLGYAPFDGSDYWCWTVCRHPNYFGEWMAWNGFIIMSIPSLMSLEESMMLKCCFFVFLLFMSRFFYDCLNFWTGAEPAEHFSVKKRSKYREYQKKTRVFFPFEMPLVDHCREAGWPHMEKD